MDFQNPPALEPVLHRVRAFVRDDLVPLERRFVGGPSSAIEPELEAKRRAVRDLGLWAPQLPREWGGMGLSLLEFAFVSEELGRTPLGHYAFNCQAPDAGNMEILMHHA